jgi:alkanesulfonate monooxygenase SsuD/methylene tetrahydromethanopterin reductase-like flavin-dependent oxidoreductase (luciferase family)
MAVVSVTLGRARDLQYGFCVPVFANPGAAFFRTPTWQALDPVDAIQAAVDAERLGYDSIWVADHLIHGVDGGIMEGWTTLSVIAGRTHTIQLGTIHMAQPFRAPALAAKMGATLDAVSGGRLIFFYDCGWNESEVRAYGLPWHDTPDRIARMDEGLVLIETLWHAEAPMSFHGNFFSTEDAICFPPPVRREGRPRPPIWLGEARDDAWLDLVAKHADGWNSVPASPARMGERIARVRAAFERAGKEPDAPELSLEIQVLIAPTEREVRERVREIAALPPSPRGRTREDVVAWAESNDPRPLGAVVDDWLAGTPEQVAEQVRAYTALGVSHFMLWFLDFPSRQGMELFAQMRSTI